MEECLICKAKLEYLPEDTEMECSVCHKKEPSKTRCVNGHYVCNACHTKDLDQLFHLCLTETSRDPLVILEKIMSMPFCHMHGPEHHVIVGAALLTAYHNSGGEIDITKAIPEMYRRGKEVPGGVCGFWGACGAGISTGQFMSLITSSTPLAEKPWSLSNRMTATAHFRIGEKGGPRCCKRDSYLAVMAAVDFVRKELGVQMEESVPSCTRSHLNNQCLGSQCPFYGGKP